MRYFVKHSQLFFAGTVLGFDVSQNGADSVDVICEHDAAHSLNEDEHEGFVVGGRCDVAKPNCEHYIDAPVIPPDILYVPHLLR